MPHRRSRNALSLATKSAELAFATPQVVAHRLARMAASGSIMSKRDQKEFHLMSSEKVAAFSESWNAMALHAARANQELAMSLLKSFWMPWAGGEAPANSFAQLQSATLGILGKGLAPVHRTATANAKRLARVKRR